MAAALVSANSTVSVFPSYVRVWAHPGVACRVTTEEEYKQEFSKAIRSQCAVVNDRYAAAKLVNQLMTWDLSGKPVETPPAICDFTCYHIALDYVETALRVKLVTYDIFVTYLKDIHSRLIHWSQAADVPIGQFRGHSNLMTLEDPSIMSKKDPEKLNASAFYRFCLKEDPNLSQKEKSACEKLMDLMEKNTDLEEIEAKGLVEHKITDFLRKLIKFYPSHTRVDSLLREAFNHFTALCKQGNAIKAACFVHKAIIAIHPFIDGNGRVARVMLNRTLMLGGHQPIAFMNKEVYYTAVKAEENGKTGAFEECVRPIVADFDYLALPDDYESAIITARQLRTLWEKRGLKELFISEGLEMGHFTQLI